MILGDCLELLLCLLVVSTANSQSDKPTTENPRDYVSTANSQSDAPTTENPRNYLFVKPRNFVKQRATNKTRFTQEEKQLFLQIHNSYRSIVEPSATDMRELVWDEDLEEYAWNHTQKCTGAHSAGTMVKKFNPNVPETWETWTAMGECLYYGQAPWYSIEEAMWMFWREGKYYDILNQACVPGQECGHYRVVTLAKSSRMGCAINICNSYTKSKYPTPSTYLACSYNGQYLIYYKPYTVGPRGSDCTYEKQSYDYQYYRYGLCITPRQNLYKTGFDGNTSVVGLPSPYLTTTSATTPSTNSPTTSTITITESSSPPPTTTESPGTSDTAVTTLSTDSSITTSPGITYTSTATSSGITYTSTATSPGITYTSTARITNSTVVVTSHQSDTTSLIVVSSTMATSSTESPTKATGSTAKSEYSSPTIAIPTTESSTSTSTKHTRIVSQSSRLCSVLPRSVLLLLFFILPICDHILYLL